MKDTFAFLFALLLAPLSTLHAAAKEPAKPNILLIYSDDHGWADLAAQGVDKDIRTPILDQLARDGVRFVRGYVTAPQCVPSRAGVLTGRYQQRFGVEDNGKGPLPLAELTIAERLKPAGYVSGQVGKWHLDIGGDKMAAKADKSLATHLPHAQGFDEYWCGSTRRFHASHDLQGRALADAPQFVTDTRFRVVVQTEAALSFLDRREAQPEQPWFLYLAWFAPHVPLESPEPWFSKTPEHLPLERRQALAMIAGMDDGLGWIRAKLKAMGADQNTLIVFIGDLRLGTGNPLQHAALLPVPSLRLAERNPAVLLVQINHADFDLVVGRGRTMFEADPVAEHEAVVGRELQLVVVTEPVKAVAARDGANRRELGLRRVLPTNVNRAKRDA